MEYVIYTVVSGQYSYTIHNIRGIVCIRFIFKFSQKAKPIEMSLSTLTPVIVYWLDYVVYCVNLSADTRTTISLRVCLSHRIHKWKGEMFRSCNFENNQMKVLRCHKDYFLVKQPDVTNSELAIYNNIWIINTLTSVIGSQYVSSKHVLS